MIIVRPHSHGREARPSMRGPRPAGSDLPSRVVPSCGRGSAILNIPSSCMLPGGRPPRTPPSSRAWGPSRCSRLGSGCSFFISSHACTNRPRQRSPHRPCPWKCRKMKFGVPPSMWLWMATTSMLARPQRIDDRVHLFAEHARVPDHRRISRRPRERCVCEHHRWRDHEAELVPKLRARPRDVDPVGPVREDCSRRLRGLRRPVSNPPWFPGQRLSES